MESSGPPRLTVTQQEQLRVEQRVFDTYRVLSDVSPHAQSLMLELWRDKHIEFLMKGLGLLGSSYYVLDANRPWICYWILNSIALLGETIDSPLENDIVDFLSRCQDSDGGYGGGPGQMAHLATTYAAVNSLITLGGPKALSSINREKMHAFLLRMKQPSGAFRMHDAGEMDVRACYTAISVASMLNILDAELIQNVGDYILSCQTFEGGIAGEPDSEAHGGYTFCGLATMILINSAELLDLPSLLDWIAFRQGVECGFQGRVNKLVDGCYSFWQGGALGLLQRLSFSVEEQLKFSYLGKEKDTGSGHDSAISNLYEGQGPAGSLSPGSKLSNVKLKDPGFSFLEREAACGPLFHSIALQQYILLCSQVLEGGFKDKPGKYRDFYHTCYCLSGLSVCQYCCSEDVGESPPPRGILGPYDNLLKPIHPLFNVVLDRYYEAHDFFTGSS
ncbi:protein farnesyltransferase subunit beta [Aristolochia californica]|uniref:protein farnesyltransferase subunit beta n=1 Tax=Aristolochia californica TaxID=171875 RepID=UPI0035DE4BBE